MKCNCPEGEVRFKKETRCVRRTCNTCTSSCYAANPERHRAYLRAYRQKHKAEVNEKSRVYNSQRRWSSRYVLLRELKSNPCVDCGRIYPYYVMDFDHPDPTVKIADVSTLKLTSLPRLLEEIGKCDLVCVNCHRLRTYNSSQSLDTNPSRRRNVERLNSIKSATPCVDCGMSFSACQMDFDHVRGVKVKEVSQMTGGSWEALQMEVSKCDLVCANCHRIRSQQRSPWALP